MAKAIPPLVKGSEDTLIKASRGNQLIDAINALSNMTFQPADAAAFDVGQDGGAVMRFNMNVFGGGGGGPVDPAYIENIVRQLLSTATLTFTCSEPGSIQITFNLPPAGP